MEKPGDRLFKENQRTEFKSSFNDGVVESLSAFANSQGGHVYIGVADNGLPVKGFTLGAEALQKWVNDVKNKTQPSIIPDAGIIEIGGVEIGELSVKEFPVKPVAFKGRYYKRINNSNHLMSLSEISNMHLRSFQTSWDSYINPERNIDELSLDKVNQFIANCNTDRQYPIIDDPLTVLNKYELVKDGQITNAAHLLFAKNDVFQAAVELGRFSTPTSIKDGLTVRSDLFTEVDQILDFIRKHINKSYIITGDPKREERWQYPMDALREIVINMIVHRDYMDSGDSIIKVYDDFIEFFNPGRLPDNITVEQLLSGEYSSWARNKRVSATFKEAHFIEKYGSGIRRIRDGFAAYGLVPPIFENFQHGFRVVVFSAELQGEGVNDTVNDVVNDTVNGVVNVLFELIKQYPGQRKPFFAEKIKVSQRTLQRWLNQLQDDDKIEFRGAPKTGGYWVIK
jgi:ATP-dependent DNA helicase RecG